MNPIRFIQRSEPTWFRFEFDSLEWQCSDWYSGVQLIGQKINGEEISFVDLPNKPLLCRANAHSALGRWQQTIPSDIRKAIQPIRSHQYRLLRLASLHTYAAQLCVENPVLFWIWGSQVDMESHNLQKQIKQELQRKQHHILLNSLQDTAADWVDRQPKSAVKVLNKVAMQYGSQRELQAIFRLLQHPDSYSLRHLTDIDAITESLLLYCDLLTPNWRELLRQSAAEIAVTNRRTLLERELHQISTLNRYYPTFDEFKTACIHFLQNSQDYIEELQSLLTENFQVIRT